MRSLFKFLILGFLVLSCELIKESPQGYIAGPFPFDRESQWAFASNFEEAIELGPSASDDASSRQLEKALNFIKNNPFNSSYLFAYKDFSPDYRWTLHDGEAELLGIFMVEGDEKMGCITDLMPGDPDDEEDDQKKEKKEREGIPIDVPLPPEFDETRKNEENPEEESDPKFGKRCGAISTIHSLIKLEWIEKSDAIEGEFLKATFVKEFDKYISSTGNSPGMTRDSLKKAHKTYMPEGQTFLSYEELIFQPHAKTEETKKVLNEVKDLLDKGWDCLFKVGYKENGAIDHVEQISFIEMNDNEIKLITKNASKQGKVDATNIIANPEDQEWIFKFPLTQTKGKKNRTVDIVQFLCYSSKEEER